MRSALYRCPALLKQARCRIPISQLHASRTRTWSSQPTGQASSSRSRFPLYKPSPEPQYDHSSYGREYIQDPDITSLPSDRKIRKSAKIQLTDKALEDMPELEEDELRDFYAAVMDSGKPAVGTAPRIEAPQTSMGKEERRRLLERMARRLLSPSDQAGPSTLPASLPRVRETVTKLVDKLRDLSVTEEEQELVPSRVSLGLASRKEWEALLDETTRFGVAHKAEEILELMSSHGMNPSEAQVGRVMERYSAEGRVTDVARLHDSMKFAYMEIGDREHDLLIEAHLNHSPPLVYPAVELLSGLASVGTPLPQSSYNVLLTHLTSSSPTAQTRALAWDLLANMRLTAHPTPSPEVYSTMIRACAAPRDPQPERARDLWIEMTETNSILPERTEYDAIIRALSSTKKTYLEAFDLLRQMLAKHAEATFVPFDESDQDIERWSRYVPTADTFCALLEGTKRAGDLNRARWILNEVVRLQASGLGSGWKGADEELLSGVFMTYASWTPVVRRSAVKETQRSSPSTTPTPNDQSAKSGQVLDDSELEAPLSAVDVDLPSLSDQTRERGMSSDTPKAPTHSAPQTSADALREADALFDQILTDTDTATPTPDHPGSGPFTQVRLSTRLVNSYLSVHLAHSANLQAGRETWERTWTRCLDRGVEANGWSFMQVLEKCSAGDLGPERSQAVEWGQEVWSRHTLFATTHGVDLSSISPLSPSQDPGDKHRLYLLGLGPRQIERSFRSVIRLLALSPSTPVAESLSLLARFHKLFPPTAVLQTYTATPTTPFQIRMTDPTATPESDIPPVMLWNDLDVVHQRLAREGRRKDIGWLTWVCKSYEVALRKRRRWRLKKKGEASTDARGIKSSRSRREETDEDGY